MYNVCTWYKQLSQQVFQVDQVVWPSCMSPRQPLACMLHQQPIWLEEFHWSPCSWLVTRPLPFLTSTASTRGLAFLWESVTLQQRMAGVAAMRTRGCGNLGVASRAWVVCQLKRLVPRRRQLRRSVSCAEQRLAGVARLIGNDGIWSVVVNIHGRVCTVSIHISTSMNLSVTCTYKDNISCTCMYFVHLLGKIHVHTCTCMYIYVHVHSMYIEVYTCT